MSNVGLQPQAGQHRDKISRRVHQVIRRFKIGLENEIANGQLPHGPDLGPYIDRILDGWTEGEDRDVIKLAGKWALEQMAKEVKNAVKKAKGRINETIPPNMDPKYRMGEVPPMARRPAPGAPPPPAPQKANYDAGIAGAPKLFPGEEEGMSEKIEDECDERMTDESEDEEMTDESEDSEEMTDESSDESVGDDDDEEMTDESDESEEDEVKESGPLAGMAGTSGEGVKRGDGRRHNVGGTSPEKLASGTPVKGTGQSPKGGKGGGGRAGEAMANYRKPGHGTGRINNSGGTSHEKLASGTPVKGTGESVKEAKFGKIVSQMIIQAGPETAAEAVLEAVGQVKAERLAKVVMAMKVPGSKKFRSLVEGNVPEDDADIVRLRSMMKRRR